MSWKSPLCKITVLQPRHATNCKVTGKSGEAWNPRGPKILPYKKGILSFFTIYGRITAMETEGMNTRMVTMVEGG